MENTQTVTSPKYAINWKDAARGLLIAVLASVLVVIENSIDAGDFNFNWRNISKVAVSAGVAYLIKNYFTPASVKTEISNEEAKKIVAEKSAK